MQPVGVASDESACQFGCADSSWSLARSPLACYETPMDFSFSDAEMAFAAEAEAWLEANCPREWRKDHCWQRVEDPLWEKIAREWQRKLFDGGWAMIAWPKEHGG